MAVLYRLGVPIFESVGQCSACQAERDIHGDHCVSCPSHGERISRHNHLRDTLFTAAVSASLVPSREDRYLLPQAEGARPADLFIPLWGSGGRDAALDVTVVSPFQQATLLRAAREPGFALHLHLRQKLNKYEEACRAQGISFHALVVETLGSWEEGSAEIIKRLGKALARATCQDDAEVTRHLFGKLSIILQRDNASAILNRIQVHPNSSVNGDL